MWETAATKSKEVAIETLDSHQSSEQRRKEERTDLDMLCKLVKENLWASRRVSFMNIG